MSISILHRFHWPDHRVTTLASLATICTAAAIAAAPIGEHVKNERTTSPAVEEANTLSAAFSSAADRVRPCVVSIRSITRIEPSGWSHSIPWLQGFGWFG